MPVSFSFKNRVSGKLDSIAHVDDCFASFLGEIPDDKRAYYFDGLGYAIIGILLREGGHSLDQLGKKALPTLEASFNSVEWPTQSPMMNHKAALFVLNTWECNSWR